MVTTRMPAPPLESAVWAALHDVHDPEIPTISVVDLGIVDRVETAPGSIHVELLPTFVGCPALDVMRLLEERGAHVDYHDPFVPSFREDGESKSGVPLSKDVLERARRWWLESQSDSPKGTSSGMAAEPRADGQRPSGPALSPMYTA